MKKQLLVSLGIVGALVLALATVKYFQISQAIAEASSRTPPPETVTSMKATPSEWPQTLESVGSVESVLGATLSAEENGRVAKIGFESGSDVQVGQVLVELDTSVEEAKLKAAEAAFVQSEKAFRRAEELKKSNAMSQASYENTWALYSSARAEVDSLKAAIGRRRIVAPFAGRTGIRLVNLGEYVMTGKPVVALHSLESVHVNFSLPQQDISKVKVGQEIVAHSDAFPEKDFRGHVNAVNPSVDAVSRNILVQATIPNLSGELRSGMFAKVSLILPSQQQVIALPATAIQYAPYGDSVFVIETLKDPAGKEYRGVRNQTVQLGSKTGDRVAIVGGLKEGEEVVTSGLFKLRPGVAVVVNNTVSPTNDLHPTPIDS